MKCMICKMDVVKAVGGKCWMCREKLGLSHTPDKKEGSNGKSGAGGVMNQMNEMYASMKDTMSPQQQKNIEAVLGKVSKMTDKKDQ